MKIYLIKEEVYWGFELSKRLGPWYKKLSTNKNIDKINWFFFYFCHWLLFWTCSIHVLPYFTCSISAVHAEMCVSALPCSLIKLSILSNSYNILAPLFYTCTVSSFFGRLVKLKGELRRLMSLNRRSTTSKIIIYRMNIFKKVEIIWFNRCMKVLDDKNCEIV